LQESPTEPGKTALEKRHPQVIKPNRSRLSGASPKEPRCPAADIHAGGEHSAKHRIINARISIGRYLDVRNGRRPRASLDRRMPDQAYFTPLPGRMAAWPTADVPLTDAEKLFRITI
jgi:hypothetical protein